MQKPYFNVAAIKEVHHAPKKIPTFPELVASRDRLVEDLKAWEDMRGSIWSRANEYDIRLELGHYSKVKERVKEIDIGFWRYVIINAGLLDAMTEKGKSDYLERLEKKPPRFCMPELEALVQNAGRIYADGFTQLIKEVHRQFIGCEYESGDWRFRKKDNLQKIEAQFRSRGSIYWDRIMQRFSVHDGGRYEDLLSACYVLDGKKKPNYAETFYRLAYDSVYAKAEPVVRTPYFSVKYHKNGNHLCTWNPDKEHILAKLNAAGTEGGLPDAMRKRYKPEHFHNGGFSTAGAGEHFKAGPDLNFFATPPELADTVVEYAEPGPGLRWLEPSAGEGALAEAIRRRIASGIEVAPVFCVELDLGRVEKLRTMGVHVIHGDFLKINPSAFEPFDRIVMNPPFHNQADVYHVIHAMHFLKPCGGLVAIMSAGAEFRQSKVAKHLREAVRARGGRFEPNPPGSFRLAGTDVKTVTLVIPPREE